MLHDLRYALRQLRKSPGFTLTAVLTLAIGIGGVTAVFSLVHEILLARLPFHDVQRVFAVKNSWSAGLGDLQARNAAAEFHNAAASFHSIKTAAMYSVEAANFAARDAAPLRLKAAEVSSGFLQTLGVQPALGRDFNSAEDTPGNDHVVIISDRLWRSRLNADPGILGRTLVLNSIKFTVVGVLPAAAVFPQQADVWAPTIFDEGSALREGGAFMPYEIARLRDGYSVKQARDELDARARVLDPAVKKEVLPVLDPLDRELTETIRPVLLLLGGAVGLVLLMICANLSGLLLVRTAERSTELALRTAVGASRLHLFRKELAEIGLLGFFGLYAGLCTSYLLLRLLYHFRPALLENYARPALDWQVLGFAALVCVVCGLFFSFLPLKTAVSQQPDTLLRTAIWRSSPSRTRLRRWLIGGQVALALVLLTGTGLLLRTIVNLERTPLGYETGHRLTFSIQVPDASIADKKAAPSARRNLYETALAQLRAIPGVNSVGLVSYLPLSRAPLMMLSASSPATSIKIGAVPNVASDDYFSTMGTPLLEGRDFTAADSATTRRVTIITRQLAKKLWPGKDPVGQKLKCDWFCRPDATVIGVVTDSRDWGAKSGELPEYYVPFTQMDWRTMTFVLRSSLPPDQLAASARAVMARIDPKLPLYSMRTMRDRQNEFQASERFETLGLSTFAAVALLLVMIGIYGLASYSVTQRNREIGLRLALGADRRDVARMFLREGLVLAVAGISVGLLLNWFAVRLLSASLYRVPVHDPATLVGASFLLLACAAVAGWLPARRAASVDPMQALRSE